MADPEDPIPRYEDWLAREEALFEDHLTRLEREPPKTDSEAGRLLAASFSVFARIVKTRREFMKWRADVRPRVSPEPIHPGPEELKLIEERGRRPARPSGDGAPMP